ncbi:MAG: Rpn family recombination-promoting nuclease/putative transposase [Isosphaerales bacterium]
MSKQFDATTKELLERRPRAWLKFLLGRDLGEVRVVNADLSTITSEADKVFRVGGKKPWMVHVELVSSRRPDLPLRIQRYNILVRCRHKLPVQSVVVLLRREADGPNLSGLLQDHLPSGVRYHEFLYNVVRVWERPAEEILAGDIATLPLAPIASVSSAELPGLIRRMEDRLKREATPAEAADSWTAAYLLMGLVYPENVAKALLQGVRNMKESTTYQAILREGRAEGKAEGKAEEARRILLRLGRKQFGPPKAAIKAKIEAITDLDRLEQLTVRILDAKNWAELIALP